MVTRRWLSRQEGRAAYPRYENLIADVARLLAHEAGKLADEGVSYIQVDAPGYRRLMVRESVDQLRAAGIDPKRELDMLVDADNQILRSAKRAGTTAAIHICHGTFVLDGRGAAGGGPSAYDPDLAAELYNRLEADTFMKRWVLALSFLAILPAAVYAQGYPSKSIRWIVPYPPGGSFDGFSRVVAAQLSIGLGQQVITAGEGTGIKTLQDLIERARKAPGKITHSSSGNGSPQHLAMELLKRRAGIDLLHVPYKGAGARRSPYPKS